MPTTWTQEQASELAAVLYNTSILDVVTTHLRDSMTFQSHMDLSGWRLSVVRRHRNSEPQRAEVRVEYNHGQHADVVVCRGSRYVITDHLGQPLRAANTLHEALVLALQELVQRELIEWPARWPYAELSSVDR